MYKNNLLHKFYTGTNQNKNYSFSKISKKIVKLYSKLHKTELSMDFESLSFNPRAIAVSKYSFLSIYKYTSIMKLH